MTCLIATTWAIGGCSTSSRLRAQSEAIKDINDSIEQRAMKCAPKQLAIARANREFGEYELGQGNFSRAGDHLTVAEENARLAQAMSDFDECLDQEVAIKVDTTPKAKIEPTPTDRDGDGYVDEKDQCPDDPEDFDGFEDEDGCPDLDNDGDGVSDINDGCPDVAEDLDGFEDADGCPDLDNDADGLLDRNDSCPDQAEDLDGYQDDDGCPDLDNDGDSIPDLIDECPNEAEDYDGDKDEDGCPDTLVKVTADRIELGQQVYFKFNKATILPVSYPLLDEVVQVLKDNPTIRIRVEGHTDSRGSDSYNKKLSDRRAASVRQYFEGKGIASDRMISVGYGEERPIEDESTEAGRAANRRVEIHITSR